MCNGRPSGRPSSFVRVPVGAAAEPPSRRSAVGLLLLPELPQRLLDLSGRHAVGRCQAADVVQAADPERSRVLPSALVAERLQGVHVEDGEVLAQRSEDRRVGKEWRAQWMPYRRQVKEVWS